MKTKCTKLARFIRPLLAGHVLAAFLAKTTAFAAGTIAFVATDGTPSPDCIGEFLGFGIGASLNNAGQAAFSASLTGTGVGSTNRTGIFRGSAANLTVTVREGQLAPDGTNRFDDFGKMR